MSFSLFELIAANMVMNDAAKAVDAYERARRADEIARMSEQRIYEAKQYEIYSREIADIKAANRKMAEAYRNLMDGMVRDWLEVFIGIRNFVRDYKAEADSKNFLEEDFRTNFYKALKIIDETLCTCIFGDEDGNEDIMRNSLNESVAQLNTVIKSYY